MDGTVRGTFDLNSEPAVRGIRSIRDTAGEADLSVKALGSSLDSVGGYQTKRKLESTASDVRGVGTAAEESRVAVGGLSDDLDKLGRKRASAHVEVNGVRQAREQIRVLEAELDRFARKHATATARVRTVGGGGLGGGGGGILQSAAASASGGAGGGSGLRAPPGLALAGLGILPAVQALGGTGIGVLGSAAAGAAGAGTVGAAGLGTAAVGFAPAVAGAKAFATEMQNVTKAQDALNQSVRQYGAASTQAATARARLGAVERANPGTQAAIRATRQFDRAQMSQVQRPVRNIIGRTYGTLLGDATRALPHLSPGIRQDTRAVGGAATSLGAFATQPGGPVMTTAIAMQQEFARDLPLVEHSLENVLTTMSNVARVALPYFHEANVWVDHQTQGWASWSNNTTKVQTTLDHGVQSFKEWRDLAGATFGIVKDLFSAGRTQGDNTVSALTTQLNTWDQWIQRNPQKMQTFFHDAWTSTKNIAGAVWEIARALAQVSNLLLPVLSHFSQLVSVAGGAGLLLPTALRAGAGYMLGRHDPAARGFASRAGAGGIGMGGAAVVGRSGGGAVVGGAPALGGTGYLAPSFTGNTVGGGAQALDSRSLMLLGSGRRTVRIGGPVAGPRNVGAAGMATPEAFSAAYGDVPGARYALPMSQLGARPTVRGRIATGGARFARGAAGLIGPALALNALLTAAQTPSGNVGDIFQNAASGATMGLIPQAYVPPDSQKAMQNALAFLTSGHNLSGNPSLVGTGISNAHTRPGQMSVYGARFPGALPLQPTSLAQARGAMPFLRATSQTFTRSAAAHPGDAQIRGELAGIQSLRDAYHAFAVQQEQTIATNYPKRLAAEFSYLTSHGQGPQSAMKQVGKNVTDEMRKMGPEGSKQLANNTLQWARQMERDNPKLHGLVHQLEQQIKDSYDSIGKHVTFVNGQILDGSKKEWGQISTAMSDPLEQAKERMQTSFTQIQQMALGSLQAMGFSRQQATNIVKGLDAGTPGQNRAGAAWSVKHPHAPAAGSALVTQNRPHQTGGRLGGVGLGDYLKLSLGVAAPGELVVNRHTERDIDRDLHSIGKPPIGQRVATEARPHSAPTHEDIMPDSDAPFMAKGGRVGGAGMGAMLAAASAITAHHYPYKWGGGHDARFSPPYDCSGAVSAVLHAGGALNAPMTSGGFMSFGDPGAGDVTLFANRGHVYMRLGNRYFGTSSQNPGGGAGFFNGSARPGFVQRSISAGGMGALGAAGTPAQGGVGSVSLHGIPSGMGGVPGALADRGSAMYAAGMQRKINSRLGAMAGLTGGPLPHGGGGSNTANMALGRRMMLAAGWPASEWPSLQALWTQESGWNANAVNRSSGAYGIPQALGHGHPFNLGDASAQIAWGLNYIRGRYGSPHAAEAHERANNWYATGGRLPEFAGWFNRGTDFVTTPGRPLMFGAGERGRERVRIEPLNRGNGGGGGAQLHIHPGAISVTGSGDPEAVAEHVVTKIIEALDRGDVRDSAVA